MRVDKHPLQKKIFMTQQAKGLTGWQKRMAKSGYDIIPFTHEEIVEHLLEVFHRDKEHFLSMIAEEPKRKVFCFVLDYDNIGDQKTIFGGTVHYDKRKGRGFTYIAYSDDNNFAVLFSIKTKVAYFSHEFWKPLVKLMPFWSYKKLTEYLLTGKTRLDILNEQYRDELFNK